mmetsp:Transcript_7713/g.8842  ORF Transcript_7713/g.8842 Transcript_7713/m.8842 type:complete len:256 (-) Transcript_7713:195-962(-)
MAGANTSIRLLGLFTFCLAVCIGITEAKEEVARGVLEKKRNDNHFYVTLDSSVLEPKLEFNKKELDCTRVKNREKFSEYRCRVEIGEQLTRCPTLEKYSEKRPDFYINSAGAIDRGEDGSSIDCRTGLEFAFVPQEQTWTAFLLKNYLPHMLGVAAGLIIIIVFSIFIFGKKKKKGKKDKKNKKKKKDAKKAKRQVLKKYMKHLEDDYFSDTEDEYYYEEDVPYLKGQSSTRGRPMMNGFHQSMNRRGGRRNRYY